MNPSATAGAPSYRPDWVDVAMLDELSREGRLGRKARGIDVLLLWRDNGVTALENRCPHQGKPLDRGRITAGRITCPFHGACFELSDGRAVAGPTDVSVPVFPARVTSAGHVEIDIGRMARSAGGWFGAAVKPAGPS